MSEPTDVNSICFSNGHTLSYSDLDEMLEQHTLIEVARSLSVPVGELMQVLKTRPRD